MSDPSNLGKLKGASANIVNTLLAAGTVATKQRKSSSVGSEKEKQQDDKKAKKLEAFRSKYLTGDLGEGMSADLNYSLKRLVKGLSSEDHAAKKGFFLAFVEVARRFKSQIDFTKLIKFIKEETKISTSTMKRPEIHQLALGQLMCLSALIDSQAYTSGGQQGETVTSLLSSFINLYQSYDFLRESIQSVFTKLLHQVQSEPQGIKVLEKIVAELLVSKSGSSLTDSIFEHSDNLSLFLSLRHTFLQTAFKD